MAEPISIASGLVALATFAFQSSIALHDMILSFKTHNSRVLDLQSELETLAQVLEPLTENVRAAADDKLSMLNLPLLRCGKACEEFGEELLKCSSRSGVSKTSFRDWARLKYMGDNIDGFKQQLSGYKSTIIIALTDANLRSSAVTEESLKSYNSLVQSATEDLEAHLQSINDKLETILGHTTAAPESDPAEVKLIKEERLSTQRCLQICARLSDHISELQLASRSGSSAGGSEPESVPQKLTNQGLEDCKNNLAATTVKLEQHMKDIMDRLVARSNTTSLSEEHLVDLTRLRDEWETTRQCRDICFQAEKQMKENTSTINNYGLGDAVQFLVSTNEKTVHGSNRGLGWRSRQFGGHMNDDSLQKISGDYAYRVHGIQSNGNESPASRGNPQTSALDEESDTKAGAEFGGRWGPGFKLADTNLTGKSKR